MTNSASARVAAKAKMYTQLFLWPAAIATSARKELPSAKKLA
jgi:hypothetical protein